MPIPRETAIGSLINYVAKCETGNYQPVKVLKIARACIRYRTLDLLLDDKIGHFIDSLKRLFSGVLQNLCRLFCRRRFCRNRIFLSPSGFLKRPL